MLVAYNRVTASLGVTRPILTGPICLTTMLRLSLRTRVIFVGHAVHSLWSYKMPG